MITKLLVQMVVLLQAVKIIALTLILTGLLYLEVHLTGLLQDLLVLHSLVMLLAFLTSLPVMNRTILSHLERHIISMIAIKGFLLDTVIELAILFLMLIMLHLAFF